MSDVMYSTAPARADMVFAEAAVQASDGDMSIARLIGVADTLRDLGARAMLLELYRIWLAHNTAHPLAFAARFNFAVALSNQAIPPRCTRRGCS